MIGTSQYRDLRVNGVAAGTAAAFAAARLRFAAPESLVRFGFVADALDVGAGPTSSQPSSLVFDTRVQSPSAIALPHETQVFYVNQMPFPSTYTTEPTSS